ncbi:biotin synthase BioB [Candidatus Electronema sp. JM]|uniref:biotin synthase BioB n=1 Tax=Candidatus Electronema sp. JM TaxID=3401571 RepID=UPI003AA97007
MADLLRETFSQITEGTAVNRETALRLARYPDQQKFWSAADRLRRRFMGDHFHLCAIINARSGGCTEDCRFCAQSARHRTDAPVYAMIDAEEAMRIARSIAASGADRLSLVTSGRSVRKAELHQFATIYEQIRHETKLDLCASMGLLDQENAALLTAMGVSRYHCNLESCAARFTEFCTTHTWQEKVDTLKTAAAAGMSLCSGGIIGMGESMEDRIDLALELRGLGIRSIPINILTPIAGTPLDNLTPLPLPEILSTIALFRFINPEAVLRMAGGRQQLGQDQYRCFAAGANGAIVGNYLTTAGSPVAEDLSRLREMGFLFQMR